MESFVKGANPPPRIFARHPDYRAALAAVHEPLYLWLAFAAIILNLVLPANLLYAWGINYDAPGGSPLAKFHPGTYLAVIAFAMKLCARRAPFAALSTCLRTNPAAIFFLAMIVFCFVLGILSNGLSGTAMYIENFVPAILLVLILDDASDRAQRVLAYLMLGFCLANAVISVGETLLHQNLVPSYLGNVLVTVAQDEFRGYALYDHPLTGAAITMIAMFLLLSVPRLSRMHWLMFTVFYIGLISFGGRTALVVTTLILGGWGTLTLVGRGLSRQLQLRDLVIALLAAVAVPAVGFLIITHTSIGERLMSHLFWDESADTRATQWHVLAAMNPMEILFGVSPDRVQDIVFQIGLEFPFQEIENFWLLLFVNLGILGFVLFTAGFTAFLIHLWRRSPLAGRLLLIALLVVASTSNSLGRKSNLLTVGVPAVLATAWLGKRREQEDERPFRNEGPESLSTKSWRVFAESRNRPSDPTKA